MRAHKPNPRRAELKALSAELRPLVKAGLYPKLNDAILDQYRRATGQQEFKTFHGWKETGFSVRKGEHGFPIWAQPRALNKAPGSDNPPAAPEGDENAPEWFPVCYLFHAGQVQPLEERKAA